MKGYGLAVSPHQDGEFSSGRDGGDVLSATGAHALEEGQADGIFGRDNGQFRRLAHACASLPIASTELMLRDLRLEP